MTSSYVLLLPVYRCTLHATLEKGIHWSEIEHLILFALSNNKYTTIELAEYSGLSRAIIVEAIVRLMRVGWVDMLVTNEQTSFTASVHGLVAVNQEVLPPIAERKVRKLNFIIEQLSGEVLSSKRVEFINNKDAQELIKEQIDVKEIPSKIREKDQLGKIELIDKLSCNPEILYADEKIVTFDSTSTSLNNNWFIKLVVTEEEIIGLPSVGSHQIKALINEHFCKSKNVNSSELEVENEVVHKDYMWPTSNLSLSKGDIVIGGPAHKSLLHSILSKAKNHIIICSTFIRIGSLEEQLDLFVAAANKGVKIDLLWDNPEDCRDPKSLEAQKAAVDFRDMVRRKGVGDKVILNDFPLESHSKIIIYDNENGDYSAVVGSCNWLFSNFVPMEVSVRISSSNIVFECLKIMEKILPSGNRANKLKEDLFHISRQVNKTTSNTANNAMVTLVSVGGHNHFIQEACQSAKQSIFLTSNKVGNAFENQVLAPFSSAAKAKGVDVTLYYERVNRNSEVSKDVMKGIKAKYSKTINFQSVKRAHAKILCWDNDHVVITSLNWLSKDDHGIEYGEIGIYLNATGIAEHVKEQYLKSQR